MGVIHTKTFTVIADIEIPLAIVGHAVDSPTVDLQPWGACACVRVVAVKCILAAYPVVALFVFVDAVGTGRRRWSRVYLAVAVEKVDAAFLNSAPDASVVTLGKTRHTAAQYVILGSELPCVEGLLTLVQLEQSFLVAAHPQVLVFVLKNIVDVCRRQVVLRTAVGHLLQRVAAFRNHQQSAARRSKIDIPCMVDERSANRYLTVERAQVVTGIGHLARSIVIAQDSVHAYSQKTVLVMT